MHGDQQARQQALETNLVALVLGVPNQIQLQEDLRRVDRLISAGAPLTPEERLEPGDTVTITAGSLSGMTGKIVRRSKQLRFLVEVEFLRRGVSVEIESWMIEPCSTRLSMVEARLRS
jgi:transcriptional antiterminator RfaH